MDPTPEEIKEAFRLFFLVKGHMDITQEMALASAPGYFKRLWHDGANGAPLYLYDEQFEIEWKKRNHNNES